MINKFMLDFHLEDTNNQKSTFLYSILISQKVSLKYIPRYSDMRFADIIPFIFVLPQDAMIYQGLVRSGRDAPCKGVLNLQRNKIISFKIVKVNSNTGLYDMSDQRQHLPFCTLSVYWESMINSPENVNKTLFIHIM